MKKGRFGIVLCFYPIVGFACVILRQPVMCLIVLALAAFLEKDEWAARQTLQAGALSFIVTFFDTVLNWAAGIIVTALHNVYFFGNFFSTATSVISALIYLAAIVFSILGILRVMKDREADIPLLCELAYFVYGKKKPRPLPTQFSQPSVPPQQPQQPDETRNTPRGDGQ